MVAAASHWRTALFYGVRAGVIRTPGFETMLKGESLARIVMRVALPLQQSSVHPGRRFFISCLPQAVHRCIELTFRLLGAYRVGGDEGRVSRAAGAWAGERTGIAHREAAPTL